MNPTRSVRTTPETVVRELDRRNRDGIDVRLLWNPQTDRVSVAVQDNRVDESFELEIEPADALSAFHHPYAYANRHHSADAFAARPPRAAWN